jgi:hypothetical protein
MHDPDNQMGNIGPGTWEYQNEVQAIRDGDMEAMRQRDLWYAQEYAGREVARELGGRASLVWLLIIVGFVAGAALFNVAGMIIGTVLGIIVASLISRRIR